MFKIKIEKEFDGTTANFEISNREEFIDALNKMWDMMAKQIAEKETVWDDILRRTEFESKESFLEWLDLMHRKGMCIPDFYWDEFCAEITDETINSMTDYHDLDSMQDAIQELESALSDIQEITNRWV